jgi:ketosteroid isomerase-like protein
LPIVCIFAGLLVIEPGLPRSAQDTGIKADNDAEAAESVRKLEWKLCDLLVRGEWEAYSRNLADDYVRILPGSLQTKQEVLDEFRTSKTKTIAMLPEKVDVRVYGDTAIVIIELRTRDRTPDGRVVEARDRATKVFLRHKGVWYLAQLSATPLH